MNDIDQDIKPMKLADLALISPKRKAQMRKMKQLPYSVKGIVYSGNKGGPAMAMQFNSDIKLYGLWEALLYVEGYEKDGYYAEGTAAKAFSSDIEGLETDFAE